MLPLVPWTVVFLINCFAAARTINIQELGDEVATGFGGKVQKQRFLLLMISTALIGGSVAFAGGIGFVGLMAPHMARRLVGSSFGALLPVSALNWRNSCYASRFNWENNVFTSGNSCRCVYRRHWSTLFYIFTF